MRRRWVVVGGNGVCSDGGDGGGGVGVDDDGWDRGDGGSERRMLGIRGDGMG